MRILFISNILIGSGLCQKLVREGNEVKLYIHDRDWATCLDGIVPKTQDWKVELNWIKEDDGVIVFDDVCFGKIQDDLRRDGYKVVGGSEGGDKLELERQFFQDKAKEVGMNVLDSQDFTSANDAYEFVKRYKKRWVIKQSSHLSCLNFIGKSKDGTDVLRVIENYKKRGISPIHLQEFASGIEVGVARYFNGVDWVGPIEINHEHKMLHDGDIGPLTPEMGTVLWYTNKEVRLFTETLDKLKPYLKEINFHGDIDINCIVTKEAAFPLEATPRFGNPSTELHVILHKSPWSEFLNAIATKEEYVLDYRHDYGLVVSVVIPPFPYAPNDSSYMHDPIEISIDAEHLTDNDFEHIHFEEGSMIDGTYYWTGKYGAVLYVSAHGKTINEARGLAYARIRHIHIPNMNYRKDIGIRVQDKDIPRLTEWGWL